MPSKIALLTCSTDPTDWERSVKAEVEGTGRSVVLWPANTDTLNSMDAAPEVELLIDLSENGAGMALAERLDVPLWLLCYGPGIRFDLSNAIKAGFVAHEPYMELRLIEWLAASRTATTLCRHRLRRRKTPGRSVAAVRQAAAEWFADGFQGPRLPSDKDDGTVTISRGDAPAGWRLKLAVLKNAAAMAVDLFTAEEWNIGVAKADPSQIFARGLISQMTWLPANRTFCFRADPFGWRNEKGETILLYEQFDYREGKGRIVRNIKGTEEVIGDFPYHASYPYLIEKDGQRYAIPELSEMACPTMYPVDEKSPKWTQGGIPLSGMEGVPLSDGTIFFHEGRYWLFGMKADQESNAVLHAWHAPDCFGPWTPHERNPIKIDITSSRPGGAPFEWQGNLIRPTQDCSTTYGAAVVLNRIDVLTPSAFSETPIARIDPDPNSPYPHGVHTLNVSDGMVLIDAKRHRRHPLALLYRWLRVQRSKRRAIVPS